jgi:hypothetical protein
MMDVCHEEFRDSIAVDGRISAISAVLGLRFTSYAEEEAFYIEVAKEAGLNGVGAGPSAGASRRGSGRSRLHHG